MEFMDNFEVIVTSTKEHDLQKALEIAMVHTMANTGRQTIHSVRSWSQEHDMLTLYQHTSSESVPLPIPADVLLAKDLVWKWVHEIEPDPAGKLDGDSGHSTLGFRFKAAKDKFTVTRVWAHHHK